jgi:hypothetical protein
MTQINPLAGAIMGSAQAQHQAAVQKQRQVRRSQTQRKNLTADDDQLEHQVESSEEVTPIHDEGNKHPDKRDGQPHRHAKDSDTSELPSHLDVKA